MTTQPHCITCGKSHNGEFCENPIPVMTPRKQGANMTTQPQQGQYWRTQDGKLRIYVHGVTKLGTVLAEMPCGQWVDIDVNQMLADWQHLPDCDSFDWQPTRYPRYWETHDRAYYAFLRQDSETEFVLVGYDGTDYEGTEVTLADRAEITEAEAMSRIVPPTLDPGEGWRLLNPDEPLIPRDEYWRQGSWRPIAAMYVRDSSQLANTHYRRRIEPSRPDPGEGWRLVDKAVDVPQEGDEYWTRLGKHWYRRTTNGPWESGDTYRRRKDLPPVEPPTPKKTRTITFCEHIVWDEPGCERLVWALRSDDLLYRHSYPTGLTRTVEVREC
jgi:hypothetical protein